jgi:hypothetical protein
MTPILQWALGRPERVLAAADEAQLNDEVETSDDDREPSCPAPAATNAAPAGRGELLALAWDDVDLDGRILRVRRTVQRLRGQGLVFGPPKSARSRRSIPPPESSRAALLSHRERQEVERLAAGDSWQESGLVFTTSVGTVVEREICPGLSSI